MRLLMTIVLFCTGQNPATQEPGDKAQEAEAKKYARILAVEKNHRAEYELERSNVKAALDQHRKILANIERDISSTFRPSARLLQQRAEGNRVIIKGQQRLSELDLMLTKDEFVFRRIRPEIGSVGYLGTVTVQNIIDKTTMIIKLETTAILMLKGHPTSELSEGVKLKIVAPFEVVASTKYNNLTRLVAEPVDVKLLAKYRRAAELNPD
jgi:hypothetical protein